MSIDNNHYPRNDGTSHRSKVLGKIRTFYQSRRKVILRLLVIYSIIMTCGFSEALNLFITTKNGEEDFLGKVFTRTLTFQVFYQTGTSNGYSTDKTYHINDTYRSVWNLVTQGRNFGVCYANYICSPYRMGEIGNYVKNRTNAYILNKLGRNATEYEILQSLVSLVQHMPYIEDPITPSGDYPKYPIETIMDEGGDCEDHAIFAVSLCEAMGYDAIFVTANVANEEIQKVGHAFVGLRWPGFPAGLETLTENKTITFLNQEYSFCETTSPFRIGENPWDVMIISTTCDVEF